MKVRLGKHKNKSIIFDTTKADNGHIVSIGSTGSGKTTQNIKMVLDMVKQGMTVLLFDTNNNYDDMKIHDEYRVDFKRYMHEVDVYSDGIQIPLFTPMSFNDGKVEKDVDVIASITESMAKTCRLGVRQKATLKTAVEIVYEKQLFQTKGISVISDMLSDMNTDKAFEVRERVSQITSHNIFRDGELFLKTGKINILRISDFSEDTQKVIIEIVLALLWKYASKEKFMNKELYLVLDEFQNMDLTPKGMISKILVEGRQHKLNLLLSTQIMPPSAQITKRITQAGLILNFRPAKSELKTAAALIESGNEAAWLIKLNQLERGKFVAIGNLIYDDKVINDPLIISAVIKKPSKGGVLDADS